MKCYEEKYAQVENHRVLEREWIYLHSMVRAIGNRSSIVGRFGMCLGHKVEEADGIQDESVHGANHLLLDLASGFHFHLFIKSSLILGLKSIGFCSRSQDTLVGSATLEEPQQWRHHVAHRCWVTGPYLTAGILVRVGTSLSK